VRTKRRAPPLESLKRRLISGAFLELSAALVALGIRVSSSLLLTRLLFPSAFGLSATVVAVIVGLNMVTDVGVAPAVIRSSRVHDSAFLGTAYSLQVLRALGLAIVASALGWPLSLYMHEPLMRVLMPSAGLVVVVHGFCSLRPLLLRRKLELLHVNAMDLAAQLISVAATVWAAWAGLGVWSLVLGALAGAAATVAISFCLPGPAHPFAWEREASSEIVQFGRWILASSMLTFGATRGDQLVLARLLSAASLGHYNLALNVSETVEGLGNRVVNSVVYPVFAQLQGEGPDRLGRAYYRVRLPFDAMVHMGLGALFSLSPWIVDLLFDERYLPAAPMLPPLIARASVSVWASATEISLMARGITLVGFKRNLAVTGGVLLLMPAGYALAGALGLLWGTVVARGLALAVLWPAARAEGLLRPLSEARVPACFAVGVLLGKAADLTLGGLNLHAPL
jgi:O-antigen/teichoic acid export membrane protein